jgi:hypothetical protein
MEIWMKRKRLPSISEFVLFFALAACSTVKPQIVEVTRIVPQTVEVTRMVTQLVNPTPMPRVPSSIPSTSASPTIQETPLSRNQVYDQGIILITQYYTFLGHGLYSDAYKLLSSSFKRAESEQYYLEGVESAFKIVKINNIQPFIEWRDQQGPGYVPRPGDEYIFTVAIVAWGEGAMSGSIPSGQPQLFWIKIVQENGAWKVDQFATAPINSATGPSLK